MARGKVQAVLARHFHVGLVGEGETAWKCRQLPLRQYGFSGRRE